MKKKIIFNTIIFVLIIAFISAFSKIFGDVNSLVGVGIATIALVLVERDLTIHPFRNTIKLLAINLGLGVFSFVSHINMWIAIPLNLIALFFIGYVFSYNLRKSTVIPFGLLYLFMLYTPIDESLIMGRFLALIIGAFLVMIFQFIFNKNKFIKVRTQSTDEIYKNILEKISLIKIGKDTKEIDEKIKANIKTVKKVILDKRVKGFYLTESADVLTQVIWILERISISLDEITTKYKKSDYILLLNSLYDAVENISQNKSVIHSLYDDYKSAQIDEKILIEFDELLIDLEKDMKNVFKANDKLVREENFDIKIPKHFNKVFDYKKDFSIDSLRFSFATRLAIAVTLGAFLTQFFNLTEGRWMVYTIFSLIQPYAENCKTKAKERVQGTIIGTLIVLVSFTLIKSTGGRFAVILLAGYLNPFFTNYRDIAVTFTISAVASAALMGGTTKFVLARISFVLLGTLIALLSNKFILPFKIEDGKKAIVDIYDYLARQMLRDVKNIEQDHNHNIKGMFLIPSLIEDRMNLLNFGINCEKESAFITNRRVLINNIYKHYTSLKKEDTVKEDIYKMISELENSLNEETNEKEKIR